MTVADTIIDPAMTRTVEFIFDAAWCRVAKYSERTVVADILNSLSYTDKNLEFVRRKYNRPINTTRYAWDEKKNAFPAGLLPRVYDRLVELNYKIELTNSVEPVDPVEPGLPEWLYPHQHKMIRAALSHYRGLIQSPTGSGKSVAIAYTIAHFPHVPVLVVVPSVDLLTQIAKTLEEHLEEPIGRIGGGYKKWGRVTVGIINSLSKQARADPENFADIKVLIWDECHRAAASSHSYLSAACINTYYRLGFSATAFREAGDNLLLEGVIGPKILEIAEMDLVKSKLILKPEYLCLKVAAPDTTYPGAKYLATANKYIYNTHNSKPEKIDVYRQALVENEERNELIVSILEAYRSRHASPALVLVEWATHGFLLQRLCQERGIELVFIHGKTCKTERQETIDRLKQGEKLFVCATRILNEGTDIPALDFVVIASGGAAHTRIVQQVGRAIRTCEAAGKERAIVVDFYDQEPYYLCYNFTSRSRAIIQKFPLSYRIVTLEELKELL